MWRSFFSQIGSMTILALALAGCSSSGGEQAWMSKDVKAAWDAGYEGQGSTIIVVDEYTGTPFAGNLNGSDENRTHGSWTARQSGLVAPRATVQRLDYNADRNTIYGTGSGLTVVNNSYSVQTATPVGLFSFDPLEQTTINHAMAGTAVVVKAAGNDSMAVDDADIFGRTDVFNEALISGQSTIFVGALSKNGSPSDKASLASYSNYAGSNPNAQARFLVVGVDEAAMGGMAGTSFGAPIVSGYAAILGSKFTSATPKQIADQLLDTARTDTIQGYSVSVHGQGEASLSRALAPNSLK